MGSFAIVQPRGFGVAYLGVFSWEMVLLAISSTFAGNLFIVGSIANLIVISQSARFGIKISWKDHLKLGLPITLISFVFAAVWLYFIS